MNDDEKRKQHAYLDKQIAALNSKMCLIKAEYMKDIWMDKAFDKDRKDILRNAELTIRLAKDSDYQTMQEQIWDLEEQQTILGISMWGL